MTHHHQDCGIEIVESKVRKGAYDIRRAQTPPSQCEVSDAVNNPAHYQTGAGIECIDVIEEVLDSGNLSPKQAYLWGSAFKYLWRLGRKGEALEDGRKAEWFLKRLNGHLEK